MPPPSGLGWLIVIPLVLPLVFLGVAWRRWAATRAGQAVTGWRNTAHLAALSVGSLACALYVVHIYAWLYVPQSQFWPTRWLQWADCTGVNLCWVTIVLAFAGKGPFRWLVVLSSVMMLWFVGDDADGISVAWPFIFTPLIISLVAWAKLLRSRSLSVGLPAVAALAMATASVIVVDATVIYNIHIVPIWTKVAARQDFPLWFARQEALVIPPWCELMVRFTDEFQAVAASAFLFSVVGIALGWYSIWRQRTWLASLATFLSVWTLTIPLVLRTGLAALALVIIAAFYFYLTNDWRDLLQWVRRNERSTRSAVE